MNEAASIDHHLRSSTPGVTGKRDPHNPHNPYHTHDTHDLAVALAPSLTEQTGGRLGPIEWFRAPWQRGGAATGFSTWRTDDGQRRGVLVKLPIGPCEYRWTVALGQMGPNGWDHADGHGCPTPRVLAAGEALGPHDLAWVIVERLQGPVLNGSLNAQALNDLLDTAAEFQARAGVAAPLEPRPPTPTWEVTIEHARAAVKNGVFAEAPRWTDMLKKVQKALPILKAKWETRAINAWCHGDLHPGNALRRTLPDSGEAHRHGCVLVDLALVHPGHWVEDALYLERQFWGHHELLHGIKPVSVLAKTRRGRGLDTAENYADLAVVRRVLMAACAPALVDREGNPRYLHAALDLIERFLPQAAK